MPSTNVPLPSRTASWLPALALLPTGSGDPPPPVPLPPLFAPLNHGPGTSGGGSTVTSGETLRRGQFAIGLRTDYTTFDDASRAEAEAIAEQIGEFDSIESTFVESLSIAWGATDDLELGAEIGYYRGSNFIDAEDEDGPGGEPAESATADPAGATDLWLTAKYRLMHGPSGHLSVIAGLKLPTGDDDDTLDNFEELEPSSQAGTGAVDYRAGLAYSRYLTARTTIDGSALYTLRGEAHDFEVGDRVDVALALAYRLTEDVRAFHAWSIFGELSGGWLDEDVDDGVTNENSGGEILYLALGVRDRIDQRWAISLAPSLPVYQDENGEQVEVDARIALALTATL